MVLKVMCIHEKARLPQSAHPGDAGLDLYSIEDRQIDAGQSALIRTGIVIELPAHTEAQVRPRSGLALKHQVTVLNSPGTIDWGYRGEVQVILINHGHGPFTVTEGMKIAQLVVKPVLTVDVVPADTLSDTPRGGGGFGSTGLL